MWHSMNTTDINVGNVGWTVSIEGVYTYRFTELGIQNKLYVILLLTTTLVQSLQHPTKNTI